jgi:hypothetical protein
MKQSGDCTRANARASSIASPAMRLHSNTTILHQTHQNSQPTSPPANELPGETFGFGGLGHGGKLAARRFVRHRCAQRRALHWHRLSQTRINYAMRLPSAAATQRRSSCSAANRNNEHKQTNGVERVTTQSKVDVGPAAARARAMSRSTAAFACMFASSIAPFAYACRCVCVIVFQSFKRNADLECELLEFQFARACDVGQLLRCARISWLPQHRLVCLLSVRVSVPPSPPFLFCTWPCTSPMPHNPLALRNRNVRNECLSSNGATHNRYDTNL